jgi:hypothetical protein
LFRRGVRLPQTSAVVPTFIANTFFLQGHLLPKSQLPKRRGHSLKQLRWRWLEVQLMVVNANRESSDPMLTQSVIEGNR